MKKGAEKAKENANAIPRAYRATKTNHRTGYHKPIRNPTTNYPMDSHKAFCKRCMAYNGGCPGDPKTCSC